MLWPTFFEKCLSMTNIFARNVDQWLSCLQKWRTTVFFIFLTSMCVLSRKCGCVFGCAFSPRAYSVLYRRNPRAVLMLLLTNIFFKMSVIGQQFGCKCWSKTVILPELENNHVVHTYWLPLIFFMDSLGVVACSVSPILQCPVAP